MLEVYAPKADTLRTGVKPNTRVIFYKSKALMYKDQTLINPNVNAKQARTLFKKVKEAAPEFLHAWGKDIREIEQKNLDLPLPVLEF